MSAPLGWWSALPRPWKAAIITFPAAMVFFAVTGLLSESPIIAIVSALLWAGVAGSYLRARARRRRER